METFYLIDFENVHNEGIQNVDSLSKTDHVHIFSTENALNIRMDISQEFMGNSQNITKKAPANSQTVNSKISAGMDYEFSGDDRSELNLFLE